MPETIWPAKAKVLTTWLFIEEICTWTKPKGVGLRVGGGDGWGKGAW